MKTRNCFTICLMFLLLITVKQVSAQTFEILLIESSEKPAQGNKDSPKWLLSGMLDSSFDNGIISIDLPLQFGLEDEYNSFCPSQNESEGYIDFLLIVFAEFSNNNNVPNCKYRLIRVTDSKEINNGFISGVKPKSNNKMDNQKACIETGKNLITECLKIKNLSLYKNNNNYCVNNIIINTCNFIKCSSIWRYYEKNEA